MIYSKVKNRLRLVVAGVLIGSFVSVFFLISDLQISPLNKGILSGIACALVSSASLILWYSSKIQKMSYKFRLLFFGISLMSFLSAVGDLSIFFFNAGSGAGAYIAITGNDFYFGGVSFLAILINFVVGSLFVLLERCVDLNEKDDI